MERFHSRGQQLCTFIAIKENFLHKKKVQLSGLVWDTNVASVSLFWPEHQYGGRDVMWKRWNLQNIPTVHFDKIPTLSQHNLKMTSW